MKIEQGSWTAAGGWSPATGSLGGEANLVLVFGGTSLLAKGGALAELRGRYPKAKLLGCSTSGEIRDVEVTDDSIVATAVHFEHTSIVGHRATIDDPGKSRAIGKELAGKLSHDGLRHVFVLSDGLKVNGSELVTGIVEALPSSVTVTGGLSGDGARFETTLVFYDGDPTPGTIALVGFYGDRLKVGYGSLGGWDTFGPERIVTKSEGNVLYELDGESALKLYKSYLGEHAEGLPATGLLFPLQVRSENQDRAVVRTILAVDEAAGSMTFAGDVHTGARAQLMKANFDRLVDGAVGAAKTSAQPLQGTNPQLAILISCVGRKLVLKQRVEEEVEGVRDVLGADTVLTGFYSYGEISPFTPGAKCELHNQTMTITTLSER